MRAVALIAVVLPPVATWVLVGMYGEVVASWAGCALAGVALVAVWLWLRRAMGLLAIGYVLAGVAALMTGPARIGTDQGAPSEYPFFDLTEAPLPESPPDFVAVRGYFRSEWVLDEYAVEPGGRPDQSREADAVLVPFAGSKDDAINLGATVVVARVVPRDAKPGEATTLRGRASPLDPALLQTLVAVASANATIEDAHGVLVDAVRTGEPADPRIDIAIVLFAVLAGLGCVFAATKPAPTASTEP